MKRQSAGDFHCLNMASDFPASSSSAQQPIANPQPAPLSSASHPASPPATSKQSLKSWWKGFRPPTKSQDTPGKSPSSRNASQNEYFTSARFVSRVPRHLDSVFRESDMDEYSPTLEGLPPEDASSASPIWQRSFERTISFQDAPQRPDSLRPSSAVSASNVSPAKLQRPMTAHPAGGRRAWRAPTPPPKTRSSRSQTFAADNSSERSLLGAGILPYPSRRSFAHFFGALKFSRASSPPPRQEAKQVIKAVEQPTGIFGVPLRQSISYANVAISLVDSEGKSYIYGYVPIVVAKCGVYLKEKGLCP